MIRFLKMISGGNDRLDKMDRFRTARSNQRSILGIFKFHDDLAESDCYPM